jgi:hypothetical protein
MRGSSVRFRWELATATAGAVLGVNPFDAPDVRLTTDHATHLLAQWKKTRRLPEWKADVEEAGMALITGTDPKPASVAQGIASHLASARPGDYIAIQAHLEPSAEIERPLQTLRALLRDRLRIATTLGFAPRYLHATGQLHKGGRPTDSSSRSRGRTRRSSPFPARPTTSPRSMPRRPWATSRRFGSESAASSVCTSKASRRTRFSSCFRSCAPQHGIYDIRSTMT